MKNPHIRTLPSHRPTGWFVSVRQYAKSARKERRLWLRGVGPEPKLLCGEIGSVSRFTFMVSA